MHRVFLSPPKASALAELTSIVDSGQIKLTLDLVFTFAEIGEARTYLEKDHAKGKVVVRHE